MQFFFATPQRLHRVHSHFFMVVRSVTEGGFLFAHSHVSSVSIEVGAGFCPQTAFGREPVRRRLAKCDAGSFVGTSSISLAPPQAAGLVHSAAPPLKIAIALLDCDFVFFAHVGATWAFSAAPHTHSLSGQKAAHSGDTRLTARCRRSAHPQGRSCRLFSRAENRHFRHA